MKWPDNQVYLFYFFLVILIIPNVVLCFTEPMPVVAKIANVLFPFACYYVAMTLSRNCGKMFWILFPFLFFGAFQIVLLYLFGQSIIAVDMFLNLATTNSSEAMELLDNLIPALVTVVIVYIPALMFGMLSIVRKRQVSAEFIRRERKRAYAFLLVGLASLGTAYLLDKKYEVSSGLYPLNVCYNVYLAIERDGQTREYAATSKHFAFGATATHPTSEREIYVLVVGETSRALNWELYGYGRETNPELSRTSNLFVFKDALTQSNTTHKSVPLILSAVDVTHFDSIYRQKGIVTAFKEAGFKTAFFSNQRYNNSFIDFFGKEADTWRFIKEENGGTRMNVSDDELLTLAEQVIRQGDRKLFIVLHTYGSHFNYRERYLAEEAFFLPDHPADAEVKYRDNLINAYDNSIRYTDHFLARLIGLLDGQPAETAMLYLSDHGEDIFDDSRHRFLHASPVPTYYQLHVPYILWTSETYQEAYPEHIQALEKNKGKAISSNNTVFHTLLDMAGVKTPYLNDSLSVVSACFTERPRSYLNDHNEARSFSDLGMSRKDFERFEKRGIRLSH